MATRRIDGAHVDHGAQFFTSRTDEFSTLVTGWQHDGLVREWCRGFVDLDGPGSGDGYPRYVVEGGMNALAKNLAHGLDVRCSSLVFSLHRGTDGRWDVKLDDGSRHVADALIVTCPLPQAFSLLVSAEVEMPEVLWRTDYDRTIALLAVLDRPSAVPAPGGVQTDPAFTFVGDNYAKGISARPALTLHAEPGWSDAHWDDSNDVTGAALLEFGRPWIGDATVVAHQVKRWRFATPRAIWPEQWWSPANGARLAVAGDAFAGPRVEGAALSGLAAARAVA